MEYETFIDELLTALALFERGALSGHDITGAITALIRGRQDYPAGPHVGFAGHLVDTLGELPVDTACICVVALPFLLEAVALVGDADTLGHDDREWRRIVGAAAEAHLLEVQFAAPDGVATFAVRFPQHQYRFDGTLIRRILTPATP